MTGSTICESVLRGAGLFELDSRGILEVTGADRVHWLNGMLSNDVSRLGQQGQRSCRALLLTHQGRIVADLQVLQRVDSFWLEMAGVGLEKTRASLEKLIIADDVALADRSSAWVRYAVEGPQAPAILARALEGSFDGTLDDTVEGPIGGVPCLVAGFGLCTASARQVFAPRAEARAVRAALEEAGRPHGLVPAGPEVLELLRIEAGIPLLGAELDESVLPAEASLEDAVSTTKGCYIGQEVVARLRTQGKSSHRLVGLRFESGACPAAGADLLDGGKRVGEVTSVAHSLRFGPIGLGFVRSAQADPGTRLSSAGEVARVSSLPFEAPREGS